MIAQISALMEHDTAGDPVSGIKWTRRTTEKIAAELRAGGIEVCPNTVARLLRQLGFRLRVNHKKLTRRADPGRDAQFAYISAQRETFTAKGWPIVSVDAKHRELVGNFANRGKASSTTSAPPGPPLGCRSRPTSCAPTTPKASRSVTTRWNSCNCSDTTPTPPATTHSAPTPDLHRPIGKLFLRQPLPSLSFSDRVGVPAQSSCSPTSGSSG